MSSLIEMQGVTKEYRGTAAVKDVDFTLRAGEIHAVVGENGAGKSTLTKIMVGVTQATRGSMLLDGKHVNFQEPAEALAAGIVMVFQETSLIPSMSVAQNLLLGEESTFNRLRGVFIEAQTFMQSLNFNVDPWADVATLGAAQKQMVEIARAVRRNARVVILDEPTATLTPEEKRHFFSIVKDLKSRGVGVIFISHALEETLEIADRITILRDGELVVTGDASEFDRASIIRHMVGRELSSELYNRRNGQNKGKRLPGSKILSVQNLSMSKAVKNNSFSIYKGQVTGIFGLVGSGRTETAKIVAGVIKRDFFHGGEILFNGKSVRYRVPSQAVKDGIVYITEDRKLEGFFETISIAENIDIGSLAVGVGNFFVRAGQTRKRAEKWVKTLNVRAINSDAKVIELSGGNQQKVVIAKSLGQEPKLIIFDEPTRGVDVGAIAEIHQLIHGLADKGYAVIVISSYLPEILNISDRILVSRAGRIVEEFSPEDATEERIMFAAVH